LTAFWFTGLLSGSNPSIGDDLSLIFILKVQFNNNGTLSPNVDSSSLKYTDGLKEADEEVAVDDTEVAVDGEENIDVDTTVKVDPNVKSVQDALTQAQAAAQKLGDSKLTDQIGNTITFFTRTHVVDQGAVAEELNESMFPLLKRILK
jgi:hypothetical protein